MPYSAAQGTFTWADCPAADHCMSYKMTGAIPFNSRLQPGDMRPKDRASFNQYVYEICRSIPSGRVMTYGGIAACIEHPANMDPLAYERIKARWVGYALKDCPDDVPWHRVINARGQISARPGRDLQRTLLEDEGVHFGEAGRIDLTRYNWKPLERE